MTAHSTSIRFFSPAILAPSDINNREAEFTPFPKSPTQLTHSGIFFRNKKKPQRNKRNESFNTSSSNVKYFSTISSNSPPMVPANNKFKKLILSPESLFFSPLQSRKSDPGADNFNQAKNTLNKHQIARPTNVCAQKNQDKLLQMINEALQKQAAQVDQDKEIETDSDQDSMKNISSKLLINCFSIDDFEKGKLLGKGQFGKVHIVKHKETGFLCAMKILEKEYIAREKMQVQIAREIKIHSCLNHPNINQMYGFSWDKDNIYLLMELCSDGEVFKILKKRRRTSEKQASFIIRQMVEAVSYMHSINVIHRDLKPQNMIMHEGLIKVIDFGWATDYKGKHRTTLCGTPLYYSPEMVKKESYDFTVDLWAIGIMTYQLMIGNIPFSIWTEMELHKIVKDEIKFPSYVEVSEAAKSFILSILQKNPQKRMKISDILAHEFLRNVNLMQNLDLFADEP